MKYATAEGVPVTRMGYRTTLAALLTVLTCLGLMAAAGARAEPAAPAQTA